MNAAVRILLLLAVAAPVSASGGPQSQIVLLDNDNIIEGIVTRVAEGWLVKFPAGGDITLPPKRVVEVVDTRADAFRLIARRLNPRDADDHLRLARWALANQLPKEAKERAEAALTLRPGFSAARAFLASLPNDDPPVPAVKAAAPVKAEVPAKPAVVVEVPVVDYNSESFPLFASRVHAILQNTCAVCHAREDAKGFRMVRQPGRAGVSRNMMSALAYIDPADPVKSPLLTKAVTPHGTAATAPLKTRNHPAYLALEEWALIARAPEGSTEPAPRLIAADPKRPPAAEKDAPPATVAPGGFGAGRVEPERPKAADPFDPATFNKTGAGKE